MCMLAGWASLLPIPLTNNCWASSAASGSPVLKATHMGNCIHMHKHMIMGVHTRETKQSCVPYQRLGLSFRCYPKGCKGNCTSIRVIDHELEVKGHRLGS